MGLDSVFENVVETTLSSGAEDDEEEVGITFAFDESVDDVDSDSAVSLGNFPCGDAFVDSK